MLLKQEPELMNCPITPILVRALSLKGLRGFNTLDDLFAVRALDEKDVVAIEWEPHILDMPLIDVSYQKFLGWHKDVLTKAGYKKDWRLYSIRYAMSNRLGGTSKYSAP